MKYLLWFFLFIAISAALLWQYAPLNDATARIQPALQALSGEDVPLSEDEKKFYSGATCIKRRTTVDGKVVWFFIIDGTKNRHAIHDPLFCFQGAGWEVANKKVIPLAKGEGVLLELKKGLQKHDYLYWFSDGQKYFYSFPQFWLKSTLRRLTMGHSGEEPVIIIIQPEDDNPDWEAILKAFQPLMTI